MSPVSQSAVIGPLALSGPAAARHLRMVVLLALASFVILVFNPFSYFASPQRMDVYFGGETAPGNWTWPVGHTWTWEAEPFRYRIVFHGLVDGLAEVLALVLPHDLMTYWLALISVILATLVFAFAMLDRLVAALGASRVDRLFSIKLFVLMPPVHNAFVMPVQSKEDFLAYGILFAGMTAIVEGRWRAVIAWTVLGALTRETLLLLPGVFLVASQAPLRFRLGALGAGLAVFAGLRLVLGMEGYLLWRPENFDSPVLVAVSLFAIFGAFWLALVRASHLGLSALPGLPDVTASRVAALWRVFPLALAVVLFTHAFAARLFEIRISFILVPWAIIVLVPLVPALRRTIFGPAGLAVLGAMIVAVGMMEISGVETWFAGIEPRYIGPFRSRVWQVELVLQAGLALLILLSLRQTAQLRQPRTPQPLPK